MDAKDFFLPLLESLDNGMVLRAHVAIAQGAGIRIPPSPRVPYLMTKQVIIVGFPRLLMTEDKQSLIEGDEGISDIPNYSEMADGTQTNSYWLSTEIKMPIGPIIVKPVLSGVTGIKPTTEFAKLTFNFINLLFFPGGLLTGVAEQHGAAAVITLRAVPYTLPT